MHQNTGDDDISFIGRGLFESLDSIGGGSSQQYQQQPQRPLSHSSSPLPSSSTPTTHHPYPSPHSRGNYFQDRTRFGDVSGEGRSRREDQPTQSTYDEDRRLQLNKPGGNPSMSFRDFSTNNGPEGYPDSPNALSFSATHQHPPQRIQSASSPGGFHPQLSQPEASTSSSSPTVLPFSTELELSNNLSPMYHPPGQHALPPDHLYQLPLLSNPQFPNSLQNHSFLQVQQQIPLSQRQQPPHLQNQSIIPIGIASSMGLPVGMGGVNPKLSQNGRVNAGSSRVGGRGEGEGQQGSGLSVGRELEEEISTIFVVGFPDDMQVCIMFTRVFVLFEIGRLNLFFFKTPQEREFQNMFTFCKDFEAATLKLPHFSPNANTAQSNPNMPSAASVAQAALSMLSNSSNGNPPDPSFYLNNPYLDPSVLDNYQDQGNSNSHGLAPNVNSTPNFNSNNVSARKQIIGFAKFKTKQAAMEARDALQGRKVDVERASVLKAEMAKKNLHTRRGVGGDENVGNGNGGMGVVSGSVGGPSTLGLGGHNVMNLMNGGMGRGRVEIGGGLPEWAQSSNPSPASATQRHFPNQIQQPPNFASFNMMQDPSLFPSSVLPGSQLAPHLQQQFSPPFAPAQSFQDQQSSSDFHSASSQAQPFPLSPPPQGSYQTSTLSSLSISDPQRGSSEDFPAFSPPMTPGSLQPLQQIQTFSLGLSQQQRPSKTPTPSSVSNPTYDSGLDPMSDQRDVSSENEDKEKRQEPMRQSSSSGDGASSSASSSFGKSGSDRLKTLPRTSNPADMNPPVSLIPCAIPLRCIRLTLFILSTFSDQYTLRRQSPHRFLHHCYRFPA